MVETNSMHVIHHLIFEDTQHKHFADFHRWRLFKNYIQERAARGGRETDSTEVELGRAREATGTQCSHAQMHSGNAASVAIHPREKQTHTPSDSDEVGVRETPD